MNRRNFIKTSTLAATAASLITPPVEMLMGSDDLPAVNSLPVEPSVYSGDFVWSAEGKAHMRKTYNESTVLSYCQDTHVKFWNQCRWSGHDLYGDGSLPASVTWDHDETFNRTFDRKPLVDWDQDLRLLLLHTSYIGHAKRRLKCQPYSLVPLFLTPQDEEELGRVVVKDILSPEQIRLVEEMGYRQFMLKHHRHNGEPSFYGHPVVFDADETHFEGLPAFW